MHPVGTWCLKRPEEGIQSLGSRVADGYELPRSSGRAPLIRSSGRAPLIVLTTVTPLQLQHSRTFINTKLTLKQECPEKTKKSGIENPQTEQCDV